MYVATAFLAFILGLLFGYFIKHEMVIVEKIEDLESRWDL